MNRLMFADYDRTVRVMKYKVTDTSQYGPSDGT